MTHHCVLRSLVEMLRYNNHKIREDNRPNEPRQGYVIERLVFTLLIVHQIMGVPVSDGTKTFWVIANQLDGATTFYAISPLQVDIT